MKSKAEERYLADGLDELERTLHHLCYSANKSATISQNLSDATEDELGQIEAFTSRFARVVDLISKRVLRSLDRFEFYDAGTLLDVANRAEKRGLIHTVDWLRELKDMHNQIAHDYAGDRLPEILAYCREELPRLLEVCQRIQIYARTLLGNGSPHTELQGLQ